MPRSFTHDSKTDHDPMTFKSERFLDDEPEMGPHNLSFGFGRHSCPGREFADATIYLTIAQTLAVFDINRAVMSWVEVEHPLTTGDAKVLESLKT
ncbi:cytochrome P450 [Sanghuangporus baumii]|uniref:Cytochrome P450 n=1 Tax=Sanghuangporus baumii TaxID=108892 RepID=A0A9Q5HZ85_SANBA|nr:cytochrome P450 [Sanghuangporus baumii]